jgi:iron complex transport system substrate-binding protein
VLHTRTARLGALALAGLMTLAACGDDGEDGGSATPDTTATTAARTGSGGEAPTTTADAAVFPRTITHAMGTTEIPEQPLRVVALDASYVDAVLALETEVVGFTSYRSIGSELPEYLGDAREQLAGDAVEDLTWMTAVGLQGAHVILDDLAATFEVSPD